MTQKLKRLPDSEERLTVTDAAAFGDKLVASLQQLVLAAQQLEEDAAALRERIETTARAYAGAMGREPFHLMVEAHDDLVRAVQQMAGVVIAQVNDRVPEEAAIPLPERYSDWPSWAS